MKREKRIKIRLSEGELADLHILAEKHHTSVARLLRDSTVGGGKIQRVFVGMDDLQQLTNIISSMDARTSSCIKIMQKDVNIYRDDILRVRSEIDGIDKEYGVVRRNILKQRQKKARSIAKSIKSTITYIEPTVLDRATSVSLTEQEYDAVRKVAEQEGRTLSSCMKAHAFSCQECHTVKTGNLESMNNTLLKQLRFLDAIYNDAQSRYLDSEDVDNIISILRDARTVLIKVQEEGGGSWQS